MKSRRTHSLQLAIGEILHNRASVQSAATKYHIPRETLRRHYQRYLKAMGIAKQETLPSGRSQASTPTKTSPIETLAAAAAASGSGNEETPSNYSSLLDIGQAYGIWNPGEDNSNDARDLKIVEDDDEEELEDNATPESPKMLTQVRNLLDRNLYLHLARLIIRSQVSVDSGSPTPPATVRDSTANNNNVSTEKSLAVPRVIPMETA